MRCALALVGVLLCLGCARQQAASPESHIDASVSSRIGLPLYPAAAPAEGGTVERKSGVGLVSAAYYRSPDSIAKVEAFYAARLPKGSLKMFINESDGGTASFSFASGTAHKEVILSADSGGTIIALSSTAKQARR
ncbi:MAG: hypothetical protein DLM53_01565 [Candidatus Eremiobacter antarcticus]|nr:hypothetical protein [Candidatus Eremiobacteraeota bacterium]MBC5808093.1 hypothetical protein [Candidatus Eremiobacteraeota bacterium]PZR63494.1 MAG: hypothetical protein DLM53_01565 [Candidatus Eremiobacter sp. RRmetagenome_bin22]